MSGSAGGRAEKDQALGLAPRRAADPSGWLGRFRRLSKDYEYLPATSEAVIYLVMIQILVHRLAAQ